MVADRGGVVVGRVEYQRREVGRQPVRLAPRSVFLAGREGLLAELDDRLASRPATSGPRVVALCGLGGAGKTSVALEYAHRHLAEVGVAWQLPAEEPAVLAPAFGELAAQLGARDLLDAADPVASVHAVLAVYPAEWLLIFDNAPNQASVAPFVPPAGSGRVLITSRNQIWPPGHAVEVPVLSPEAAAEFLVVRTDDQNRQAAVELAVDLGGLPLALEQAAAYVQASAGSLAEYLSSFRQRRVDMLARGEPIGYSQTVATTWRLAFEDLQQAALGAAGLLRLLAFCAPEAIPLRLLLQPRPDLSGRLGEEVAPVLMPLVEDSLAARDAIAALRRYSLVTPARDGSVSVHRLVQAVTVAQLPPDLAAGWRRAAALLTDAALPYDPEDPAAWSVFATLLPHAQAALAPASDGMQKITSYLGSIGNYAAARTLQQQVLDPREAILGPEHPGTLAARVGLARWTGQAGDAAAARDQLAALLPVDERVLGAEHLDTLTVRSNLANWTGHAGDAALARDQYAALLPVLERVLGAEHPLTLTARGTLAHWTGEAGDPAAARDQYAALVPVRKRVQGGEHPRTLNARADLANWTGEAGDAATARDQLAALAPVREQVQGAEHPRTLVTRADLAYWTGAAGDAVTARDQYTALTPVFERVLGAEHPRTLDVRSYLAHWTGQAGAAPAARDQYAALVPVFERVLGAEHPRTLDARAGLAYWSRRANEAAQDQGGTPAR